jgi:hypothetical protein
VTPDSVQRASVEHLATWASRLIYKIWHSIFQTLSDLGNIHDRSIRAFAVKPRALDAPLSGFGA